MPYKRQIAKSFGRMAETYDTHAQMQRRIAQTLCQLMGTPRAERVMEIGCGTGFVTRQLTERYGAERITINDISAEMCQRTAQTLGIEKTITGDAESIELPTGLDLIVSASTFQWFADLRTALSKMADSLNTGGTLAFSTFGPDNLREVRGITGRGLHYPTPEEIEEMLRDRYTIETTHRSTEALLLGSAMEVVRHLHHTGVNALRDTPLTRSGLSAFCSAYEKEHRQADGQVPLTYDALYFVCKKQ